MKNITASTEKLLTYLIKNKIATIDELKTILKTQSGMTTYRRLSELGYISSCSHSGKYYSLKRIARYNKYGLWLFNSVLFSKYGTLKNTLEILIYNSSKGYTASELNRIICLSGWLRELLFLNLSVIFGRGVGMGPPPWIT